MTTEQHPRQSAGQRPKSPSKRQREQRPQRRERAAVLIAVLYACVALPLSSLFAGALSAQDNTGVLARKGNTELIRLENDKALRSLTDALSAGGLPIYTKASILNDRGLAYTRLKQHEEALADYNKAIEIFPEFATAYNNRGLLLHKMGFYEEAIKDFNRAIALQPRLGASFHNRGNALLKTGAEKAAYQDYSSALKYLPSKAATHLARGQIHWSHQRHYAALRELNQAITENTTFAESYFNRAEVNLSLGHNTLAIKDFQKATALAPDNMAYKLKLALVYIQKDQYKNALRFLNQVLTQEPLNTQAMILRARSLGRNGDLNGALNDLDQAVSLKNSASAYAERALILAKTGQLEASIKDMDTSIQRAPKTARSWAALGQAAMLNQLPSNAERYFLESLKRDKTNKMAFNGLVALGLREPNAINREDEPEEIDWTITRNHKGHYIASHPDYQTLKVHLDLYGAEAPQILEWTVLNGKYKGFGLLRYDAGVKDKKNLHEHVSVINLKKQKVLSIEPYRWGKKISKWEWGDYDLIVKDPDGISNTIALRPRPVRKKVRPRDNELWAWGENGFWAGNPNAKKKKIRLKKKKRKKKKKSIFKIFGF